MQKDTGCRTDSRCKWVSSPAACATGSGSIHHDDHSELISHASEDFVVVLQAVDEVAVLALVLGVHGVEVEVRLDRLGGLPLHARLHVPAALGVGQDREVEAVLQRRRRLLQRQRQRVEAARLPVRGLARGVAHATQVAPEQVAPGLVQPLRHEVGRREGAGELVVLLEDERELVLVLLDVVTQRRVGEVLVGRVRELEAPDQLVEQRVGLALEHAVDAATEHRLALVLAAQPAPQRSDATRRTRREEGVQDALGRRLAADLEVAELGARGAAGRGQSDQPVGVAVGADEVHRGGHAHDAVQARVGGTAEPLLSAPDAGRLHGEGGAGQRTGATGGHPLVDAVG
eukprot:Opistho-1_new@23983